MGFVEALKTGRGHYLAMFHDDGRFFTADVSQGHGRGGGDTGIGVVELGDQAVDGFGIPPHGDRVDRAAEQPAGYPPQETRIGLHTTLADKMRVGRLLEENGARRLK